MRIHKEYDDELLNFIGCIIDILSSFLTGMDMSFYIFSELWIGERSKREEGSFKIILQHVNSINQTHI